MFPEKHKVVLYSAALELGPRETPVQRAGSILNLGASSLGPDIAGVTGAVAGLGAGTCVIPGTLPRPVYLGPSQPRLTVFCSSGIGR